MLIDEPQVIRSSLDPIMAMLSSMSGRAVVPKRLQQGIYEIGHFGSSRFLSGYEDYAELGEHNSCGVCDGAENLLEVLSVLQDPERKFVVTLTKVKRDPSNAGKGGGLRWRRGTGRTRRWKAWRRP